MDRVGLVSLRDIDLEVIWRVCLIKSFKSQIEYFVIPIVYCANPSTFTNSYLGASRIIRDIFTLPS